MPAHHPGPANAIPYDARLLLKSGFGISGYHPAAWVALRALKHRGMFPVDRGNV